MIEAYFEQLGFHSGEVRVYLGLAETGKATPHVLAKRLGLPRTTVYSVLDKLLEKGMVSLERKQRSSFYVAQKPQVIFRSLEAQREALKAQERIAAELVKLAEPYFKSKLFSVPKLQFFEGKQGVENLLYDYTEEWRREIIADDGVWWGYQDHTFVEQYRPWLEKYWSVKTAAEKVHLISNEVVVEKDLRGKIPGREILAVGKEFQFTSTIWVCGNYIVLVMTRQPPHYAIQLRDPVFAANLRLVFRLLWSVLSGDVKRTK